MQLQVTATTTQVGSPFGGLIYVVVSAGARLGMARFTFAGGAVKSPWFVRGVTTPAAWAAAVRARCAILVASVYALSVLGMLGLRLFALCCCHLRERAEG